MTEAILRRAREIAAERYVPGSMPYRAIMTGQFYPTGSVMRAAIEVATAEALRQRTEAEDE